MSDEYTNFDPQTEDGSAYYLGQRVTWTQERDKNESGTSAGEVCPIRGPSAVEMRVDSCFPLLL